MIPGKADSSTRWKRESRQTEKERERKSEELEDDEH